VGTDVETRLPLTPNHFLSGAGSQTLENLVDVDKLAGHHLTEREQETRRRLDDFWEVWSSEYLTNLPPSHNKFRKRGQLKVGSIVLVKEDNMPRMKWILGRVMKLHLGRDELPRAVELKTRHGIINRPIQRLYDLEIENVIHSSDEHESVDDDDGNDSVRAVETRPRPRRNVRLPMKYTDFDMS
jgi:hypothetical protein